MQYLIVKSKSTNALNVLEKDGVFYLTTKHLINSTFVSPSLSDAIQTIVGKGDGTKEKPYLDISLDDKLNLAYLEDGLVNPFDDVFCQKIQQNLEESYKLVSADLQPSHTVPTPSFFAPRYAKNRSAELRKVDSPNFCIVRLSKQFDDNYKLGDKVFIISGYCQAVYKLRHFEILDHVDEEYLYENQNVDYEKYSYFVAEEVKA
ncbi:hypothetical protein [Vibrio sp. D431a]|uniref:hypothetical protein n=1 Tax=Vibrio sp. D431a TaxID=2837388 RepID=UPI0025556A4A|nr:hypothetical protein [Vibrio sp. D431a]MDK9789814.1 hypothetical protein [Vibrio sp. D431a]